MLVLAIDDEPAVLAFYKATLKGSGVQVECVTDAAQGLEVVRQHAPEVVLLDLTMPSMSGMEVLRRIRKQDMRAQVVMITGNHTIESAVEAIREGAADYICKPISPEKLQSLVEQAKELAIRRERAAALEKELAQLSSVEGIIGRSPRMLELFDMVRRVAPHFRTVLVLGETGTGKELVARALHRLSARRDARFAICNCAAVVETLMESELFGHRKGAFTGAHEDKIGLFEWADGGIVFLDEVGELGVPLQAKLLRTLQSQEIQKLGSPQPRKVDVLVIAATSRDLERDVKAGKFRADLWYRLNMIQIQLPPLRDRREDIGHLCRHFLDQFNKQYGKEIKGISRRAQDALLAHAWPGNVRELENVIGRACMLAQGTFIDSEDLRELPKRGTEDRGQFSSTLEDAEKEALLRVLDQTPNRALAARILGVSRATLYRLMEKYGIKSKEEDPKAAKGR